MRKAETGTGTEPHLGAPGFKSLENLKSQIHAPRESRGLYVSHTHTLLASDMSRGIITAGQYQREPSDPTIYMCQDDP